MNTEHFEKLLLESLSFFIFRDSSKISLAEVEHNLINFFIN